MLQRALQIYTINLAQRSWPLFAQLNTTISTKTSDKERWDLFASVLVERLPIVSKSLAPLEREFQEYLWKVEYEKSLKSDHELQHEREMLQADVVKAGNLEVDLDEASAKQTAQDLEDAYTEELNKFKVADRITVADKTNNVASSHRKLEETLFLITEHLLGNKKHFLLPQGLRLDGETMRQAAERVLREQCGDKLQVQFYGNTPCGFHKYKYPSSMRRETSSVGAKLFFYRASLKNGSVDANVTKHFRWVEKCDLANEFSNSLYHQSVQKFLY